MATPYEISNRWLKATALASKLFAHGVTSDKLPLVAEQHWLDLARACELNPPSAECQKIVGHILAQFEGSVAELKQKRSRITRVAIPRRISGKTA